MKILLSALSLLSLGILHQATAQELGNQACRIALPGITFTRSLN
jgi:hypothetical protein